MLFRVKQVHLISLLTLAVWCGSVIQWNDIQSLSFTEAPFYAMLCLAILVLIFFWRFSIWLHLILALLVLFICFTFQHSSGLVMLSLSATWLVLPIFYYTYQNLNYLVSFLRFQYLLIYAVVLFDALVYNQTGVWGQLFAASVVAGSAVLLIFRSSIAAFCVLALGTLGLLFFGDDFLQTLALIPLHLSFVLLFIATDKELALNDWRPLWMQRIVVFCTLALPLVYLLIYGY